MNKAKIAAIVYDMTNQETFDNIQNWYNELKDKNDTVEMIGIIANKSDLAKLQRAPKNCISLPTLIAETQHAIA